MNTYSWLIYSTVQSIQMSLSYRVSQYRTHLSGQLTGYAQAISQQFDFHYIIWTRGSMIYTGVLVHP